MNTAELDTTPGDDGTDSTEAEYGRRSTGRRSRPSVQRSSVSSWILACAVGVLMPPLAFVVLRPDWYALQNTLDPFFYTGYTQNLSNAIAAVGDSRYFVTRWTLYLPGRLSFELFGPFVGFIVFRWVLSALCMIVMLRFGSRRWGWSGAWLASTLVLLNPMFLRAVFVDYSDAIVVPAGIVLVLLLAARPRSPVAAGLAGIAGGAAIVANAFAATTVLIALATAVGFVTGTRPWRVRAVLLGSFGAGFAAVLLCGLLLFRWRYGIDNVYEPTIDFVRGRGTARDPLKRSTLEWMTYYLWIYLPPLIVGLAALMHVRRVVRFERSEWCILVTCAIQYAFQVWYQFARDGATLELTYYWAYMLPSLLAAFAVVVGRSARHIGPAGALAIGGTAVLILALPGDAPELLPTWWFALLTVVVAIVASLVVSRRTLAPLVAVVFALPLALPLWGPRPLPVEAGDHDLRPQYDTIFVDRTTLGQKCFNDATWFQSQLRRLPPPVVRDVFYLGGTKACGQQMLATAMAHVSGRRLNGGGGLGTAEMWARIDASVDVLGMVGRPDEVEALAQEVARRGIVTTTLLDAVRDDRARALFVRLERP